MVAGVSGPLRADALGGARCFREELALAAALQGDEPEGGCIHALAHGEQAVVLVDGGLALQEVVGEGMAGRLLQHHLAAIGLDQAVVVVEGAAVLRDRIEPLAQAGEGLAVGRMGMGRGDHLGTTGVDGGMQHEGGPIDRPIADHHLTGVIHEQQVAHPHPVERQGKRIHPEVIGILRIAGGDVPGHPFPEPQLPEDPQRPGQPLLAMQPFLGGTAEARRREIAQGFGGEGDAVDHTGNEERSCPLLIPANPLKGVAPAVGQWCWG